MAERKKNRSPGEGNFRKRGNTWECRVMINYVSYSVSGKTRRECAMQLEELKEKLLVGVTVSAMSLGEWMTTWISNYVSINKKPSTIANYEAIMNKHILPELGRSRMDRITKVDVQRFIGKKTRTSLSARTVRLIHHVLRCSLNVAVDSKLIPFNPAKGIVLPQIEAHTVSTISPANVGKLYSADLFESEPLFPCVLLMVSSGLRRGEALALRWSDVDLENRMIVVRRELVKTKGGAHYQTTKSKNSNRLLPISDFIRDVLISHKQRQDMFRSDTAYDSEADLVFARIDGKHYYPDSLRKVLHRILNKAGIGSVRVHDLRHTCATILLMAGTNPKIVQEILGHGTVSITLDTYSHVMPSLKRTATDQFDSFITNSSKKTEGQSSCPNDCPTTGSKSFLSDAESDPENKRPIH